ncbi:MAG: GntR family transcriptional regulator [Desulfovibrio sp.]
MPKNELYKAVRELVVFTPNAHLEPMRERALAKYFGISRTPLREVLKVLAGQGLVNIVPYKGIFAAVHDNEWMAEAFETRKPLEQVAARLAAERRESVHLGEMKFALKCYKQALNADDRIEMIRQDMIFHEIMWEASNNKVLQATLDELHWPCLRFWVQDPNYFGFVSCFDELNSVYEAIKEGFAQRAEYLIGKHIAWSKDVLENVKKAS